MQRTQFVAAKEKSNKSSMEQSYAAWVVDLKRRYRATQIKAGVAVNSALIEFYWNLGKDISERFAEEAKYGSRFFEKVSCDMRTEFPNDSGFSPRNIRYCQGFYRLYSATQILQQVVAQLVSVPWGHHCTIIDKCKGDRDRALIYVRR